MTTQKQGRFYGLIAVLIVILLLAGQYMLQRAFRAASEELASVQNNLVSLRKTADDRSSLVERYKQFEKVASAGKSSERIYPENALELFAVVDRALKDNFVEHTNRSSGIGQGGTLQLQITFTGPYYGVLKALALIRESEYVMRISEFRITAGEDGKVNGTMTILSVARQS